MNKSHTILLELGINEINGQNQSKSEFFFIQCFHMHVKVHLEL